MTTIEVMQAIDEGSKALPNAVYTQVMEEAAGGASAATEGAAGAGAAAEGAAGSAGTVAEGATEAAGAAGGSAQSVSALANAAAMSQVEGTEGLYFLKSLQLSYTGLTAPAQIGAGLIGSTTTAAAGAYNSYYSSTSVNGGGCNGGK